MLTLILDPSVSVMKVAREDGDDLQRGWGACGPKAIISKRRYQRRVGALTSPDRSPLLLTFHMKTIQPNPLSSLLLQSSFFRS